MDSAMRDLERLQERPIDDDSHRYFLLWVIGLVVALGVVLASLASLPNDSEGALKEGSENAVNATAVSDAPKVDPKQLTFPQTLVGATRPEVAAAMAAAAAELEYPDPVVDAPPVQEIVAGLPAAVTATTDSEVVEHVADADPLVASAAKGSFGSAKRPERAAPGREGAFVLQVASYQDAQEARVFAEALRRRGHSAYVVAAHVADRGPHWRVRIGPFDARREATRYRKTFEREEGMNTFVVRNR